MHIQSINYNLQQQNFKGKFIKNATLEKAIEHSSLTNLNRFCKYLEKMAMVKDSFEFSLNEKIKKSKTPNYIESDIFFEIEKPCSYYRKILFPDSWPKDTPQSNFNFTVAIDRINRILEEYYPNSADTTDRLDKDSAIKRINYLLEN